MTKTLFSGNWIKNRGFGIFEVREYDGLTVRNSKTEVKLDEASNKRPFVKTGKDLKERILER